MESALELRRRVSKYKAIRTNGYASKKEANRAAELAILAQAGKIREVWPQPKFLLLKADELGRAIHYVGDFSYWDNEKQDRVVEDVKGFKTPVYKLKRRMMWALHKIKIVEV